jgi:hypothetical protein
MPNEFIIKNGFRSQGNSEITGSINVSAGITGSLQGTASFALAVVGGGGGSTWGSITGTLSNQTDLSSSLASKHPTLVSGTSIKTINGNSVLGSGNISITSTAPRSRSIQTFGQSGTSFINFGNPTNLSIPIDISVLLISSTNTTASLYLSTSPSSVAGGSQLVARANINANTTINFTRTFYARDTYNYQGESEGDIYNYTSFYIYSLSPLPIPNGISQHTEAFIDYVNSANNLVYYLVLDTGAATAYYSNTQYGT